MQKISIIKISTTKHERKIRMHNKTWEKCFQAHDAEEVLSLRYP